MTSLRTHLSRTLLGAILVLEAAGGIGLYFAVEDAVTERFDSALKAKALAISTLTKVSDTGIQVDFSDHFMQDFEARHPRDYFELWDASGVPLERSESLGRRDLERRRTLGPKLSYGSMAIPGGRPGRAIGFTFVPHAPGSGTAKAVPVLTLIVVSDASELREDLLQLSLVCLGTGVALLSATLWLIPRVLASGLKPLEDLGERAASIDSSSLGTRFAVEALPEELRPIAVRLNDLLARIEQSFERERRFTSDLAHELRTPLAELRSTAECALKWPKTRSQETDADTLAIAAHMERIVALMLSLARGEQGLLRPQLESVAIDEAVTQRWRHLEERARHRGLRVELGVAARKAVADPSLLRSILDNVLENAVDYTPAGGRLAVNVPAHGATLFCVGNRTDELRAEDLPRIFERFWRKEAARSDQQHLGLGLCLSRSLAETMGLRLEAAMPKPGFLEISLKGPDGPAQS